MKRTPIASPLKSAVEFQKVFDNQGERVRGLWVKKGVYYAQLDANNGKQYKYPLTAAKTIPQALTEMQVLKKRQRDGQLSPPEKPAAPKQEEKAPEVSNGRTIKAAIESYQSIRNGLRKYDEDTCLRQDSGLSRWIKKFGNRPIEELNNKMRKDYAAWRQTPEGGEVSGRTCDIDITAINNVMTHVVDDLRWLPENPFGQWQKLAKPPKKVRLLEDHEISAFLKEAIIPTENLQLFKQEYRAWLHQRNENFADYLAMLVVTGGREQETIQQKWSNVNWRQKRFIFPGTAGEEDDIDGAKAGAGQAAPDRYVDFHPRMEEFLRQMEKRRDKSCDWMFPNEDKTGPQGSFRKQFERVREKLHLEEVGFHWFRHYFISMAMMAKPHIDVATIAFWVGHRDKGVLILQKYGHLRNDHTAQMAQNLSTAFAF